MQAGAAGTGIHRYTLTRAYAETAERVDLQAIDRLCTFFAVPIGHVFEHVPAAQARK